MPLPTRSPPDSSRDEIKSAYPDLSCVAALESPSTGIVNTQSFMQSLVIDFEAAGWLLYCRARALRVDTGADLVQTELEDGTHVTADIVIDSAGLSALSLVPSGVEYGYENFFSKAVISPMPAGCLSEHWRIHFPHKVASEST